MIDTVFSMRHIYYFIAIVAVLLAAIVVIVWYVNSVRIEHISLEQTPQHILDWEKTKTDSGVYAALFPGSGGYSFWISDTRHKDTNRYVTTRASVKSEQGGQYIVTIRDDLAVNESQIHRAVLWQVSVSGRLESVIVHTQSDDRVDNTLDDEEMTVAVELL
jgi:hypothetical protein